MASRLSAGPGDHGGPLPKRWEGLRAIEFPLVLELIARRATSPPGADRVRALRPVASLDGAREALATTDEVVGLLLADSGWGPPPIPELGAALRRLAIEGSVLEANGLRSIGVLLRSSRTVRRELRRRSNTGPRLAAVSERMIAHRELEERLGRSIDETDQLTDAASDRLRKLRGDLRTSRRALVDRLERFVAGIPERYRVPDASVTVRSGRYCVPVRREGRSEIGGIIHDESSTHQTLFVEPPVAIEPMNRIRELELEEAREMRRILAELTEAARPLHPELTASWDALTEVDALYACARYALEHGGVLPELTDGAHEYRVAGGSHPLLLAGDEPVVPFDLRVDPEERVVLISGPNAGGKTVLLKAIGLLSAMAQSGIVPPVRAGSRLPVFDHLFAVIGDEQSIAASLSTFSAHVEHLRLILGAATPGSLVLVDEIGANTDPAEGAALASAVLLELASRSRLTIATTHLGELKGLADEDTRVVNASLQFDATALKPSFFLRRDRPGRSYALEIAERLGLPAAVLARARERLSVGQRAVEGLLASLERRESELGRLSAEAAGERRTLARRRAELEERLASVERREEEARREGTELAERYLLEARAEVESAIERLEREYDRMLAEWDADEGERRAAASRARGRVEAALRELRAERREPMREPDRGAHAGEGSELVVGRTVRLRSTGGTGRLLELRGRQAVVETGGVRLTLPAGGLEAVEQAPEADRIPYTGSIDSSAGAQPRVDASPEIDLRGLRTDEIEAALLPALDAAVVHGLARMMIVHGKGTGALRAKVKEVLEADPRVGATRSGTPLEGGSGVTIVEIRDG